MSSLTLQITELGRAALVTAEGDGTAPVQLSTVAFTATAFTPAADGSDTELPDAMAPISTIGGTTDPVDATMHVTVTDDSMAAYTARGFGLYLEDGTLFALYGQADPIVEKAAAAVLLLAVDVVFVDINVESISLGAPTFANPAATTSQQGIVELATTVEAVAGVDTVRAVTPAGLSAALLALSNQLAAAARWVVRATGTTLAAGARLIPDNGAAAVSYLLPAAPVDGDTVSWRQGDTSFATHAVTFQRNGKTIMDLAEDMTVSDDDACGSLVWRADLATWWVYFNAIAGTQED